MANKVLIYGGRGALGSALVDFFKSKNWWVASVDFVENDKADLNILLTNNLNLDGQATLVSNGMSEGIQLNGIVSVAGGWAGGNLASKTFLKSAEQMLEQSVWSSYIAASLAPKFLMENGLLVLTGAQPALKPTPGMIGYGVAKAAVHHLVKSIGADKGGLPAGGNAYAILPVTLDTPMNRKWMTYDETWTPLEDVAKILYGWLNKEGLPPNGSLVQLITKGGKTDLVIE
jgi:dihydropteridine reductase